MGRPFQKQRLQDAPSFHRFQCSLESEREGNREEGVKKGENREGMSVNQKVLQPVAPVKMQGPPQLSEHDTLALCIQPSLCVWVQSCVYFCVCMVCLWGGSRGKAAVQGTAMASGACCGVTRLMRQWGDTGASGAPLIKIHHIHSCTRTKKELRRT